MTFIIEFSKPIFFYNYHVKEYEKMNKMVT